MKSFVRKCYKPLANAILLLYFFIFPSNINAQLQKGTWQIFNTSNSSLPSNHIRDIAQDNDNSIWFGSDFGGAIQLKSNEWTIYNTLNSGIPSNTVNTINIDSSGTKWFGTDNYASKFDGTNWTTFNQSNSGLPSNQISYIGVEDNGTVWFGTWGGGVAKYYENNWVVYDPSNSGLPSVYIVDILFAKDGSKWFTTVEGVSHLIDDSWITYTTANSSLPVNDIRGVSEDIDGSIWFGTIGGGVVRFDGSTWTVFNTTNTGIPSDHVFKFYLDIDNSKWFSTKGGAVDYDNVTWDLFDISNSCLPTNDLGYILIDSSGYIWFGTGGGGVAVLYSKDGSNCNASPPTPSLTPIPTPVPETNDVVIVPGMGASWNQDAILNCKINDYTGGWDLVTILGLADGYINLSDSIQNSGKNPHIYTYDWRKDVREEGAKFGDFLTSSIPPGRKVDIVAHSLGGLVSRAYAEQYSGGIVDKFLTAGTPHRGTLDAYYLWEGGEFAPIKGNTPKKDLYTAVQNAVLELMIKNCSVKLNKTEKEIIQTLVPSVKNLLPVSDYLISKKTKEFLPELNMTERNNYIPTSTFLPPYFNITVGTLSGFGYNTPLFININEPNHKDKLLSYWNDGRPLNATYSIRGDTYILNSSSQLPSAENILISGDHGDVIGSAESLHEILGFLKLTTDSQTLSNHNQDTAILIAATSGNFNVSLYNGENHKSENGLLIIGKNLKTFTLETEPGENRTLYAGKIRPNEPTIWKQVHVGEKSKKHIIFEF